MFEFDVRFFTKERIKLKFNLSRLPTKHGSAGAPFHRQPGINWILTHANKTEQYLQMKVPLCFDEASRVACNSGETQTSKILLHFGRDGVYGEIQASELQE